jgi:hypothetical protein
MNGELLHPQTETMAQIHEIRNITPGAIALCGILVCYFCFYRGFCIHNAYSQARWALSSDDTLQEVGSSTGIRYFNDFEEYLTILETGLGQKKKSIINVIKQWDEKIFPNSHSSLVTGKRNNESNGLKKAMDLLAADSEADSEEDDEEDDEEVEG